MHANHNLLHSIFLIAILIWMSSCGAADDTDFFPFSHHINYNFDLEESDQWGALIHGEDTVEEASTPFVREAIISSKAGVLYSNSNDCRCQQLTIFNRIGGLRPDNDYLVEGSMDFQALTPEVTVSLNQLEPTIEKNTSSGRYALKTDLNELSTEKTGLNNNKLQVLPQRVKTSQSGNLYLAIGTNFTNTDSLNLFIETISISLKQL